MHIISDFPGQKQKYYSITNIDSVGKITELDIVHRYDSFDPQLLQQIYSQRGYPGATLNDHYITVDYNEFGSGIYTVPAWAADEARRYNITDCNQETTTEYSAFICSNNIRVNRYLALKFAEWFKINYEYTWSGSGASFDCAEIIQELEASDWESWMPTKARSFLLAPIQLQPRWIKSGSEKPKADQPGYRIEFDPELDNYHTNSHIWRNATRIPHSHAAVTLITEPIKHQRAAIFTEKTVHCILAANFPIWIGGYQQARAMAKIGFDTFNDIVDHSYQDLPTLVERCWAAFERNRRLLSDVEYGRQLRQQCRLRLQNNQQLLLSGLIDQYCVKEINSWPEPVRQAARVLFAHVYGLPLHAT